jgi:hypothetical protein
MSEVSNESSNGVVGSSAAVSSAVGVTSSSISLPGRRRLIKLGVSAVPVVATLASQSALATNCITTSAWGSDQISNSASQAARHAGNGVPAVRGWTISKWNLNSTGSDSPWKKFKQTYPNFKNKSAAGLTPASFDLATLTFDQLFACVGSINMRNPTSYGYTGTDTVVGHLTNDDKGYFLVAQLNFAIGFRQSINCVKDDAVWLSIVAGTYASPVGTAVWSVAKTRLYLEKNYIVVA